MPLDRDEFLEHMRLIRDDIKTVRGDVQVIRDLSTANAADISRLQDGAKRTEDTERLRRHSILAVIVAAAGALATGLVELLFHVGRHP